MYLRRQTRGGVKVGTRPCTSDGRQEVVSRWEHGHVPQTATRGGVKVETQPCISGDGHVLHTTDERWGQNRNTAMYSVARQTRTGTGLKQPCTSDNRREVGSGWKHNHVLQATGEKWGQGENTAMYFRRQTRAGVRMETQPYTSDDRRELGSGWKHSHNLQTTDERWGQNKNTAMYSDVRQRRIGTG